MSSDRRASEIGDLLSVVVAEAAESRNSARNISDKSRSLSADVSSHGVNEYGAISLGSQYAGSGEIRRSESLLTSISVTIADVLPNGDYLISGEQRMHISGEWTTISIRGRIRDADISSDNEILSNRIANAEINYNGQGFVSRGARPGIIEWLFSLFGFGS